MDNLNKGGYKGTGKYGVINGMNYLAPTAQNPYGSAVSVNSLMPTSKIKLPEPTPTLSPSSIILPEKSQIQLDAENATKEKNTQIGDYLKLLTAQGQIQGQEAGLATEAGADKAQEEYDRYKSELEAEQRNLDLQTREAQTEGMTVGQRNARIADMNRVSYQKQADIAILANSAKGRFDTAIDIAKRKVESQLAPIKAQIDAKKFYIENKKDEWTTAQTAEANRILKAEQRTYDEEKAKKDAIENIKLEYVKNGGKDLSQFKDITTVDEALAKASGFLMSPMEKLQMEKLRGDIAKNTMELLQAKQTIGGTTGDPVSDIIAGSSRYGDKRLTDSQLEKIQKATNALSSMETLQGLLKQGKDGIDVSGPLTGRLRTLATQLGGDANASAINATIQGLIPTVARGIFGEVGVLTDADIENYRKTVPNLVATGEQNKLISLVMYDVLNRSLENTLITNAQNQANVSGFLNTYQDTKNRINTLKSNLGVVEKVPISAKTNSYLDNKLGPGVVGSINSAITNYSSQFTRKTQ